MVSALTSFHQLFLMGVVWQAIKMETLEAGSWTHKGDEEHEVEKWSHTAVQLG